MNFGPPKLLASFAATQEAIFSDRRACILLIRRRGVSLDAGREVFLDPLRRSSVSFPFPRVFMTPMTHKMLRSIHLIALTGLLVCLGCGKTEVAGTTDVQGAPAPQAAPSEPSPMDVVSQFLDQVRRGGEDSGAGQLLTQRAQQELARIGRSIQPIGSPDAGFKVTRFQQVEEGSALVHSIWSEPDDQGGHAEYQVVWAVEHESAGWRISGLAMQLKADEEPVIIDFENGELMAEMLGATSEENSDTPSQASGTAPATLR